MASWVFEGRREEKIGGGFFVFRRHRDSGRISMAKLPFEYPNHAAAAAQATVLANKWPGQTFIVVHEIDAVAVPKVEAVTA